MKKAYTLSELAALTGSELRGNPETLITGIENLEDADSEDASFLTNARYRSFLSTTHAGVICIDKKTELVPDKNFLICQNPDETIQIIAKLFLSHLESGFTGIHSTAVIHPTAKISPDAHIGPYAVIDKEVEIGPRSQIGPFVSLGARVRVGADCQLYPHSVVREGCELGNRVILQPGAIIGSCGFGYTTSPQGTHTKLEQLGIVIIEDDVEIGANSTIDRARFKNTRIGKGTKIDNLVQIAHNVELGPHNIIVSQTGIAGSTKTGRNVVMGGQVGIVGHLEIGDFVMIATRGGVSKSIKEGGKYGGEPVMPLSQHNRMQVHLRKIEEYIRRIEALEKKLSELETVNGISNVNF